MLPICHTHGGFSSLRHKDLLLPSSSAVHDLRSSKSGEQRSPRPNIGKGMRKRQASGIVWATIFLAFAQPSHAAEYGWGTYLLGVSIPMMGFTPPPGIYLSDTVYAYQGNASALKMKFPNGNVRPRPAYFRESNSLFDGRLTIRDQRCNCHIHKAWVNECTQARFQCGG